MDLQRQTGSPMIRARICKPNAMNGLKGKT